MNKYLYKIKDLEVPPWLKYWFARKSKVNFDLSEILNGTSFDLTHTVNKKLHLINIFGNSNQDETPTPENPIDINSSADNGFITEKIYNKNLLNPNEYIHGVCGVSVGSNGTISFYSNSFMTWIKMENGKTYKFSGDLSNVNSNVIRTFVSNSLPSIGSSVKRVPNLTSSNVSYTNSENYKYLVLEFLDVSAFNENYKWQIVEGLATSTEFEPHQSQVFAIPCQQPMRSIGDVKDTFVKVNGVWYERHYIKELDLKEINLRVPDSDENNIVFCNLANTSICDFTRNPQIFMSDYFKYEREIITGGYSEALYYGVGMYSKYTSENARYLYFVIPKTIANNLEEVNNWITTNNIKIYYVAENPVDTPCTTEQITALENLQKARTYNNITHIYSDDEVPAELQIQYYKEKGE